MGERNFGCRVNMPVPASVAVVFEMLKEKRKFGCRVYRPVPVFPVA